MGKFSKVLMMETLQANQINLHDLEEKFGLEFVDNPEF
jgi:hypothetical protein